MADTQTTPPPDGASEAMFPSLTRAQQSRVKAHGRVRPVESGETLAEPHQTTNRFFSVISGELSILNVSDGAE